MAWKPKTIAGKILKGVAIGGAAVAGVAAIAGTGGAAGGVAASVLTGLGTVVKKVATGAKKTVSTVANASANLVTGLSTEQRKIIEAQKDETRTELKKLEVVDKLIKAGATVQTAAAKAGVALSSLAGMYGLPSEAEKAAAQIQEVNYETKPLASNNKLLMYAGGAVLALFLLPKLLGGRRQ